MTGARARLATATVLLAVVLTATLAPAQQPTSRVVVNVGTFRNLRGILGCRLHRTPQGFPEDSPGAVDVSVRVAGNVTQCAFEAVPPGVYAVSVMHDENDNRKLDRNLFGVPTEGYGVSNNHTYALSSPKWDESKFVVESGKSVGLGIALRY